MKTIIWVSIIVLTMVSTVYAKETYTDLSNVQFRVECSNSIGNKTTYANEPQKTKYFLMGPNMRMKDKGVMDLGAYKKGTIRLVKGGGIPDRVEMTFGGEAGYGMDDKIQTRFYKVSYFNFETIGRTVDEETAVLDENGNLKSAGVERLKNCQSMGLPW